MPTIDTVVIGAGHAGLAVSRLLSQADRDHVVLEAGAVGESWRTARWDSMHLVTPNWMNRLPGRDGTESSSDPDGYLPAADFCAYLTDYAESFSSPVLAHSRVRRVQAASGGVLVDTDQQSWQARHVVIATGPGRDVRRPTGLDRCDTRHTNEHGLREGHVVPASSYRHPGLLPDGGVLVVGASASGVQIADELARAGRDVVLAVGQHTRAVRRYRGHDLYWWLERTGRLRRTIDQMPDRRAARREPSFQLSGRSDAAGRTRIVDLAALQARGVVLTGRLIGVDAGRVWFRDDLTDTVRDADSRLHRLLDAFDAFAASAHLGHGAQPRPGPVRFPVPPACISLRDRGITTVVLATGYRPAYPWLRLPILDRDGRIVHVRGATPWPGVQVVGERFQHRRDSQLIGGAGHDARSVVDRIVGPSPHREPALPGARPARALALQNR